MSAPAPLLKPKFKTSCQADLFDAFEVEIVTSALEHKGRFEPRPRMAFDFDDAILAMAEMLKAQGTTPAELAEQIGDHRLHVVQTRILSCDGKNYEHMRLLNKNTHETIWTRLEDYYGGAKVQKEATLAVETQAPVDEGTRMISMNAQNREPDPVHPRDKPKKVLAVRTVYDGSGERDDRMKEALSGLTADTIPAGGLVITMGKNGPKILKAASAQTDEEQAEDLLDENEAAPVSQVINTGARVQAEAEVTISRDPNPEIPGLPQTRKVAAAEPEAEHKDTEPVVKRVLETRVMSGDAMERMPVAKVAKHEAVVFGEDLGESDMDVSEAAALIDAELGGDETDMPETRELQQLLADPKDPSANLAETLEHGGRRVKKQEGVVKKDRGGTRPTRPAQV